jgi:pre-mRNA-processing factor SLU7
MINPHNPDFITKKPWYLTGSSQLDDDQGPSIEHQKAAEKRLDTSLEASERLLEEQRKVEREQLRSGQLKAGQWVEALKKNKLPYVMCQIVAVHGNSRYDLRYEDGSTEALVKQTDRPRIRPTKAGNRAALVGSSGAALSESWDSKRDKYHGYDRETHNAKLSVKYEEREKIRSKLREQLQAKGSNDKKEKGEEGGDDEDDKDDDDDSVQDVDEEEDDEFVQRDEQAKVVTTRLARQGGVGGAQMKVTARNLRIREDTAKYLRNLNIDSAYYDPKSRSMRDNPNPEVPLHAAEFAGDNFTRISGDAVGLAETQLFAWEAAKKGVELHMQAVPSLAEKAKKEFKSKSSELQMMKKKAVLDKYGGEEHLDGNAGLASAIDGGADKKGPAVDKMLRFGVSTAIEDHNQASGGAAAASEKRQYVPMESQYEEDIFINGHTTVWGSYFHRGAFQWGYADDHSLMKNSYCTGVNGRIANDEANEMRFGTGKAGSAALAQARGMLKGNQTSGASNKGAAYASQSKLYGEADPSVEIDSQKLKAALARSVADDSASGNNGKRKYHSMAADVNLSQEDMEAYRLTKERKSDPMANVGSDELLEYKG